MRLAPLLASIRQRIAGTRVFATGGGPPDLEDLWRDFNRKLSGMFGGGGGGRAPAGGGGEPSNMKLFGGGVALVRCAPAVEKAWADTVKTRLDDLDSGRVQGVPAACSPAGEAKTGDLPPRRRGGVYSITLRGAIASTISSLGFPA